MNYLKKLQKELNIVYPELYKKLYKDGMLDWGETGKEWFKKTFPKLKKNPPLLLLAEDIEIWNPIIYKKEIANMLNHQVYDIQDNYQLVPFAKNAAGDLYVFQYDVKQNDEVPVSLFSKKDSSLKVLARNIQDFIFRKLLESLRELNKNRCFKDDSVDKIKAYLQNQMLTHRPYLTDKQIDILQEIYFRDLEEFPYTLPNGKRKIVEGLVSFGEVEEILKREIDFEYLDKKFDYIKTAMTGRDIFEIINELQDDKNIISKNRLLEIFRIELPKIRSIFKQKELTYIGYDYRYEVEIGNIGLNMPIAFKKFFPKLIQDNEVLNELINVFNAENYGKGRGNFFYILIEMKLDKLFVEQVVKHAHFFATRRIQYQIIYGLTKRKISGFEKEVDVVFKNLNKRKDGADFYNICSKYLTDSVNYNRHYKDILNSN